jgi:hypothetical protein
MSNKPKIKPAPVPPPDPRPKDKDAGIVLPAPKDSLISRISSRILNGPTLLINEGLANLLDNVISMVINLKK